MLNSTDKLFAFIIHTFLIGIFSAMVINTSAQESIMITFNDNEARYDSIVVYDWDTENEKWENDRMELFSYDELGRTILWQTKKWDDFYGTWQRFEQTLKTYTEDHLTEEITQEWRLLNGIWRNKYRNYYVYNESGNRVEWLRQNWFSTTTAWENFLFTTFDYDQDDNDTLMLQKVWDAFLTTWINSSQTFNFYNDSGFLIESFDQNYMVNESVWKNTNREVYTYDTLNRDQLLETFSWDDDAKIWANNRKYSYSYDSVGNLKVRLVEDWNDYYPKWENKLRTSYYYSPDNLLTHYTGELWDTDSVNWIHASKCTYYYDEGGNRIQAIYQDWNKNPGEWINDSKVDYIYINSSGFNESGANKNCIKVPNPYVPGSIIQLNCYENVFKYQVQLFTPAGQLMFSKSFTGDQFSINNHNLTQGIYLMRVAEKDRTLFTGKILIAN